MHTYACSVFGDWIVSVTLIIPPFHFVGNQRLLVLNNELEKKMGSIIFHNVLHFINAYSWSSYHFLVFIPNRDYSDHFNPTQHYSYTNWSLLIFLAKQKKIKMVAHFSVSDVTLQQVYLSHFLVQKPGRATVVFNYTCHVCLRARRLPKSCWCQEPVWPFSLKSPSNWVSFMS